MRRTNTMTVAQRRRSPPCPRARRYCSNQVRGTIVRFSGNDVHVDVTIRSNHPTSRDLLSMLPLRFKLLDSAAAEKIGGLPRRLRTKGSPGSTRER